MKKYIIMLLIVMVALAIFLVIKTDRVKYDGSGTPATESGGASGQFMKLSENAIVVLEQRVTDRVVVNAINIENPGFVIIHRDASGKPGAIIGVSKWFPAGQYADEEISLTETLMDGMNYYAALRTDNGDGIFDPKDDTPVESSAGDIVGVFQANKDAQDPRGVEIYY